MEILTGVLAALNLIFAGINLVAENYKIGLGNLIMGLALLGILL